jgi:molybdate transport system permease protein
MIETQQLLHPLLLSLKTVAICAFLFLSVGIPAAYYLSKENLRYKWLFESIVTLPLVFPPIAVGFFLLMLLGRDGLLGGLLQVIDVTVIFEFPALVIAGFIAGLPLMVKPLQSAIEHFPKPIVEASFISGKSEIRTLFSVILPTIKKSLVAALLIASARALGEVGITLMLGGNIIGHTDTISLALYNAVIDGEYRLAWELSAVLTLIALVVFFLLHRLQKNRTF